MSDADRAISAWRRVVGIAPSVEAFDSLARLHLGRAEPGQAAEWLEKRFEASRGKERTEVLRLVDRLSGELVRVRERLGEG